MSNPSQRMEVGIFAAHATIKEYQAAAKDQLSGNGSSFVYHAYC
jgi:hypothetical protein